MCHHRNGHFAGVGILYWLKLEQPATCEMGDEEESKNWPRVFGFFPPLVKNLVLDDVSTLLCIYRYLASLSCMKESTRTSFKIECFIWWRSIIVRSYNNNAVDAQTVGSIVNKTCERKKGFLDLCANRILYRLTKIRTTSEMRYFLIPVGWEGT